MTQNKIKRRYKHAPIIISIDDSSVWPTGLPARAGTKVSRSVLLWLFDGYALFDECVEADVFLLGTVAMRVVTAGVAATACGATSIDGTFARVGILRKRGADGTTCSQMML